MPAPPSIRAAELEERLIRFAVSVVKLTDRLPSSYAGQHFGRQLLRSGSAPALLYGEARGAESTRDFRHKLSIALKELRESHINLRIIKQSSLETPGYLDPLIDEANELISIFVSTVKTLDYKIKNGR